jgi:hypothetical protein
LLSRSLSNLVGFSFDKGLKREGPIEVDGSALLGFGSQRYRIGRNTANVERHIKWACRVTQLIHQLIDPRPEQRFNLIADISVRRKKNNLFFMLPRLQRPDPSIELIGRYFFFES